MLLIRQALELQMAPISSTGLSVMVENRELLGIPLEVPDFPPSRTRKPRTRQAGDYAISEGRPHDPNGSNLQPSPPPHNLGLPEAIARGLLDKGESLGINKAFMTAVSDLKVFPLYSRRQTYSEISIEKSTRLDIVFGPFASYNPTLFYCFSSCG
jgi:TBC1 domain family member 5